MITFNHVDGAWDRLSEGEREEHNKWLESFTNELREQKNSSLVFVVPAEARKTVRKHEDGTLETYDGPAIPGPEQIGGYYIIEAETIDEAVIWAEKGRWLIGSNEVRQIFSLPA